MVRVFSSESFVGGDTNGIEKLGKGLLEIHKSRMEKKDFYSKEDAKKTIEFLDSYKEELDASTAKEDLTFDKNGSLYTTIVSDFIERKVRPTLVAENIIKRIRVDAKGTSSIKVPISNLQTASDLPDNGNVTYAGDNNGSHTIKYGWVYAANKITFELLEQSNVDLIQAQLYELGDAISRKIDSDIIAAIDSAITVGTNGTDLSAANITYADFLGALAKTMENNVVCDAIVINPTSWKNLMSDSDVKNALAFNSVQAGSVFPLVQNFFGLKMIVTPQVGANNIYLVDSKRTGYFVESSGVNVYNDRVSGTLAQEVIASKLYGVGVVQPLTVYRVREQQ